MLRLLIIRILLELYWLKNNRTSIKQILFCQELSTS